MHCPLVAKVSEVEMDLVSETLGPLRFDFISSSLQCRACHLRNQDFEEGFDSVFNSFQVSSALVSPYY